MQMPVIMVSSVQAFKMEVNEDKIMGEMSRSLVRLDHVGPGGPWPACPWAAMV